jgi:glucose/mannose-6-phosphate isomerase
MARPGIDLYVHRDYGLPPFSDEFFKKSLLIASSYSGNTEEVVSFVEQALVRGYPIAIVTCGGKLLELAEKNSLPHIKLPDVGIQPRSALGFSTVALAKLTGDLELLAELRELSQKIVPGTFEKDGKKLAEKLKGKIPLVYSSVKNLPLAYNWKIKFNETGKVPAFYNLFSEMNHNEISGFDPSSGVKNLITNFSAIFLTDDADNSHIQKRMVVCKKLYEKQGIETFSEPLAGGTILERAFNSLLLADWTALYIANASGADPEKVPLIEEFKKHI